MATNYTSPDICKMFNITRARLQQLRTGRIIKANGQDYKYDPVLIENEDWKWERGRIVYFESAVRKLELRD